MSSYVPPPPHHRSVAAVSSVPPPALAHLTVDVTDLDHMETQNQGVTVPKEEWIQAAEEDDVFDAPPPPPIATRHATASNTTAVASSNSSIGRLTDSGSIAPPPPSHPRPATIESRSDAADSIAPPPPSHPHPQAHRPSLCNSHQQADSISLTPPQHRYEHGVSIEIMERGEAGSSVAPPPPPSVSPFSGLAGGIAPPSRTQTPADSYNSSGRQSLYNSVSSNLQRHIHSPMFVPSPLTIGPMATTREVSDSIDEDAAEFEAIAEPPKYIPPPDREASQSWWSRLTYSWVGLLISTSAERTVTQEDVYALGPGEQSALRLQEFETCVKRAEHKKQKGIYKLEKQRSIKLKKKKRSTGTMKARKNSFDLSFPPQSPTSNHTNNQEDIYWPEACDENTLDANGEDAKGNGSSSESNPEQPRTTFPLYRSLWYQFGRWYCELQLLLIIYTCLKLVQPLMLYQIVTWLGEDDPNPLYGYIYAIVLGISALCIPFVHHAYWFKTTRLGQNIKIAVGAMIYKKTLQLKISHMISTTTGAVINLIANDVYKMEELIAFTGYAWNLPCEIIIVISILYYQIGVAAFAGLGAIMLFLPMQGWFAQLFIKFRIYLMRATDHRMKLMNEILVGADVAKMLNWEASLEARVMKIRNEEFRNIEKTTELRAINKAAFFVMLSCINLCVFSVMHFRGITFTPANVFTTISFFNTLKYPVTHYIPQGIGWWTETKIAYQRVAKYLSLDDEDMIENEKYLRLLKDAKNKNMELREVIAKMDISSTYTKGTINMQRASFVWELTEELDIVKNIDRPLSSPMSPRDDANKKAASFQAMAFLAPLALEKPAIEMTTLGGPNSPTNASSTQPADRSKQGLQYLDLSIPSGTLVGVIGSVGSYKSSFLAACLGEMQQVSGGALIQGRVSYAGQTAWIFSGTIRENILFGRDFDAKRYARTLRACQLMDDIDSFAFGDQTVLGDKGNNLSGGQRARVGVARTVYAEADIYLFDDPLAALDPVVAKRLYEEVMSDHGMLSNKTRVLVTHQTHLLTKAHIILLEQGRIVTQGNFEKLVKEGYLREEHRHESTDANSTTALIEQRKLQSEARQRKREMKQRAKEGAMKEAASPTSTSTPAAVDSSANILIVKETSSEGKLDKRIYLKLFRAGGGLTYAAFVFGLVITAQGVGIYTDKWLSTWSAMSADEQKNDRNAYIYIGLVCSTIILGMMRARVWFFFLLRAAARLHNNMLHSVLYSPQRFFESNPVGRILNRFAKEVPTIDESLPTNSFDFVQLCAISMGSIVVIGIAAPFVLLAVVPTVPAFLWVRARFINLLRDLKRLDSLTRSPIYAHFASTLSGLMIIRSAEQTDRFVRMYTEKVDTNTMGYIINLAAGRWFGLRLDLLCGMVVCALGVIIISMKGSMTPAAAGFAISYGLTLTALFQWAVRQSAEVEANMTAVENVSEYGELKPEGVLINPQYRPSEGWPAQGKIEFKDYKMRYRPGLDLTLKGVSLSIQPGEKVGVCGRTGAGKSSLFQSLLRIVEADSGSIEVDGMELGKLGLSDLRSNLAIIPQYPVIFSGTLRYNLDPFEKCTDEAIMDALDAVQLKSMVLSLRDGLMEEMSEFGSNFSVGECQLICVARAILKKSKVLCVDEATANVDQKTDQLIQTVIREKFKDRTVLTIAHRLNTILECDKIVVMAAGRVGEVGSPAELLARPPADLNADPQATYGLFSFMAKQKGHGSH